MVARGQDSIGRRAGKRAIAYYYRSRSAVFTEFMGKTNRMRAQPIYYLVTMGNDTKRGYVRIAGSMLLALITLGAVIACGGGVSKEVDALDVVILRRLANQAMTSLRARMPDAVLAQIDVNPETGAVNFRIVNGDSTFGADVVVPSPDIPVGEWQVLLGQYSPLSGVPHKNIDLRTVVATPGDVLRAAFEEWPGCKPRGVTLVESDGVAQWWYVFCEVKEGIVSGSMDSATGEFFPSDAPPQPLGTATP